MRTPKIVNQNNPLKKSYVPKDMIIIDDNKDNFHRYLNPKLKPKIKRIVFEKFQLLAKDAKKAGYKIIINSAYRSYNYQLKLYNYNVQKNGKEHADKYVAKPGMSEHQSGYAFDIAIYRNNEVRVKTEDADEEIIWMKENAHKYGFILRYPKGKESITKYNYEPWHYRYVGEEIAKIIYKEGITLEEYLLNNKRLENQK